ncbi:hypothetical protein [Leptolyngbya ohadii]|uniref:hypothetical protein n=1 Tax=Leptolyngbya ohadii TaxID=1962290 RepID=UPI00117A1961|nr:hypothetical protein [Leptolyngbya ohadii]
MKSYSLTPNSAFSADVCQPDSIAEQFSQDYGRKSMPIAARRQSQLAHREMPIYQAGLPGLGWLHSTRNLDFCLLALCSCLMAILCHQVVVIPGSSAAASSMASSASTSRSAQLDFLFKAGLFTGKSQQEIEAEEAN